MKILQINKFFYVRGGSERVFFDTIKILEERGHKVVTFSMKMKEIFLRCIRNSLLKTWISVSRSGRLKR